MGDYTSPRRVLIFAPVHGSRYELVIDEAKVGMVRRFSPVRHFRKIKKDQPGFYEQKNDQGTTRVIKLLWQKLKTLTKVLSNMYVSLGCEMLKNVILRDAPASQLNASSRPRTT